MDEVDYCLQSLACQLFEECSRLTFDTKPCTEESSVPYEGSGMPDREQ